MASLPFPDTVQMTSRWPAELEAKQRRLAAVQDTLNNGINSEVRGLGTSR